MALDDARVDDLARRTSVLVNNLARAAFSKLWSMLLEDPKLDVREAMLSVQVEFGGAFAEQLAQAMSEMLQRAVGVVEVRAMPIGRITLSRHLWRHAQQTAAEVTALVRLHASGVTQARELALSLYDGYSPGDAIVRPLEGRARTRLPKALRELASDPGARVGLERVIADGQAQAARLKSRALRAAYTQTLDAWEAGAGRGALERKLEIAVAEKNRFYADRIAQTELARAHQDQVAEDFLADDSIEVVQVRINPAHPAADICDLHARADLYGLGHGCYPKDKAPRPPFHPFCWCRLSSRPSLSLSDAKRGASHEARARAFLRGMPADEAARVVGSRERLQRVFDGASALDAGG